MLRSQLVRSVCAVAAIAVALGGVAAAKPLAVKVPLQPQHGSKISGTATIMHGISPNTAIVTIALDGVFIPENAYPAGIYRGACADITAASVPIHKLNPVMSGRSTTNLKVRLPLHGKYAIAVFDTKNTQTISCGGGPLDRKTM